MAYNLDGFVERIILSGLIIICGHMKMLEELNNDTLHTKCLCYHNCYHMIHLSPFLFCYTFFASSPITPAIFLIHKHELHYVHDRLMEEVEHWIPNLARECQYGAFSN